MPNTKSRPSKTAKAAKKILNESKLLANSKEDVNPNAGSEFKPLGVMPKTSVANKIRPNKKRG